MHVLGVVKVKTIRSREKIKKDECGFRDGRKMYGAKMYEGTNRMTEGQR